MDWVKLAVRYYADPKVAALPDADTELLFVRGLARAGEQGAAGFIPESALTELARRRRYAACVDALISAGLWSRVDGGYRITRWADWQGELDVLAKRRAADRERQRRRRAAAESTLSRDNGHTSRDSPSVSRDVSRDVTPPEGEGELEGVHVGGTGTGRPSTGRPPPVDIHSRVPPPSRCPAHRDQPAAGNCGPCGDWRRHRLDWDRQHTAALTAANHQAAAERQATPRCRRCGTRHTGPCTA